MLKLYLDTSVILKRYIQEAGTETADLIFDTANAGELTIAFSLWNIGEALGVLDVKRRRGLLTEEEFTEALRLFSSELLQLMRLKTLEIIPIQTSLITKTWNLLLDYHIYEGDALQIATCDCNGNDALLTNDEKLAEVSEKIGLETVNLSKDKAKLETLLQQTGKQNHKE